MLLRCDGRGQIHARPHVFCKLQLWDSSHSTDSLLSQSHRPNMNFKPILACVFLGPIFTLIGIACLNCAMTEWKFGNESLDWPTVSGTIESSTVKRTKELDSTDYPAIRYRYTVNNQPYTSDQNPFRSRDGRRKGDREELSDWQRRGSLLSARRSLSGCLATGSSQWIYCDVRGRDRVRSVWVGVPRLFGNEIIFFRHVSRQVEIDNQSRSIGLAAAIDGVARSWE